ncbi:hypothetical protein BaRGS_00016971, partial [Batillaria attramentaria]
DWISRPGGRGVGMGCGGSKQTATDQQGSPKKGNAGKGQNSQAKGTASVSIATFHLLMQMSFQDEEPPKS